MTKGEIENLMARLGSGHSERSPFWGISSKVNHQGGLSTQ